MQGQPSVRDNSDELRVLGLIAFVSILVGTSIGVFDARMWLYDESSTYTNVLTYTMGAFTLQGMAYVIYKMLMQDSMDTRATFARMQQKQQRQMQGLQQQFAHRQMEAQMQMQEMRFHKQIQTMQTNPELMLAEDNWDSMTPEHPNGDNDPPQHKAQTKEPMSLGADVTKDRDAKGQFSKKDE